MTTSAFAVDLELYGPEANNPKPPGRDASRRYCRKLARTHYENFPVASCILPRHLRQHFYHVYAYCRWADDLADQTGDPSRSLALLDWWEDQLHHCYRGHTVHPVFTALAETIREFQIPIDPFGDLLVAFRQDQRVTRYDTFQQLLDYCRYSANPVGHLVLHLARCHQPRQVALADAVCTGLQLANFWQDVARDWERGRVYLPREHFPRHGFDESMLALRQANEAFRSLLAAEVAEAEAWLRRGLPLVHLVPGPLRLDVSLFIHGGLAILEAIRRQGYDVWSRRPTISRRRKLALLIRGGWQLRRASSSARQRCVTQHPFPPPGRGSGR